MNALDQQNSNTSDIMTFNLHFQLEFCAIIVATVFAQAKKHRDTVEDGIVYLGALYFGLGSILFTEYSELPATIEKLPVFYKQRDLLFYPSWIYSLPGAILGIPLSSINVVFWVATTYFVVGFDSSGIRSVQKKQLSSPVSSLGLSVLTLLHYLLQVA
jgi:hypothetical protein